MKHEGWVRAAAALGVELDTRAERRLSLFEELLVERAAPMGMIVEG